MKLERDLHELGYTYTGPASIYSLTWIELMRLVDAADIIEDMKSNVRTGDLEKLDRFDAKLREKAQ